MSLVYEPLTGLSTLTADIVDINQLTANTASIGTLSVSSSATIGGSLVVNGTGAFYGGLSVTGGNSTITGNTYIIGSESVTGNLSVGGGISATGSLTTGGDVFAQGGTGYFYNIAVQPGTASIGTLDVGASASIGGSLVVNGTGAFYGGINVIGNSNINGFLSATGISAGGIYTVNPSMSTAQIQTIINSGYGTVFFQPGFYDMTGTLNVNENNIILDGQWSTLFMATGANSPNFAIGDLSSSTPSTQYSNIVLRNFYINGNSSNQTSEYMTGKSWVTNCCVFATYCGSVWLNNLNLTNARSGGMTITYQSNGVSVDNCTSNTHYFDNYTSYGSTNLRFSNNYGTNCSNGGGLSMDDACQYVTVTGNSFSGNKLGIFARDLSDTVISGNSLSGNTQQGLFLSGYGVSAGPDLGLLRWVITGNSISENGQQGLWVQSFNEGSITGNVISNNGSNGLVIGNDTSGYSAGTSSYNNISGNTICSNGGYGVYADPANSYTAGARSNFLSLNIVKNNTSGNIGGDLTSYTLDDDTQLNTGEIYLHANNGYSANILPSTSGNTTLTLPPNNGFLNYVLQTDGSTNSNWTCQPSVNSLTLSSSGALGANLTFNQGTATTTIVCPSSTSIGDTFGLPPSVGIAGQYLTTDGFGYSSWSPFSNIIQITFSTTSSTTSTSFVPTGPAGSITPTYSTSGVLITAQSTVSASSNNGYCTLMRNSSTELSGGPGFAYVNNNNGVTSISMSFLDYPNTTSSTTYQVGLKATLGGTVNWNPDMIKSILILQEIK